MSGLCRCDVHTINGMERKEAERRPNNNVCLMINLPGIISLSRFSSRCCLHMDCLFTLRWGAAICIARYRLPMAGSALLFMRCVFFILVSPYSSLCTGLHTNPNGPPVPYAAVHTNPSPGRFTEPALPYLCTHTLLPPQ